MARMSRQKLCWFIIIFIMFTFVCSGFLYKVFSNSAGQEQRSAKKPDTLGGDNNQNKLFSEDEKIYEELADSFDSASDQKTTENITSSAGTSSEKIVSSSDGSDLKSDSLVDQRTEDGIKNHAGRQNKYLSELEKTKIAFNNVFENDFESFVQKSRRIKALRKNTDETGQAWMKNALMNKYETSSDPVIRKACLFALIEYRDKKVEIITKALSDKDRNVRVSAAGFAFSLKEDQVEIIHKAIKEDIKSTGGGGVVARTAILSLGQISGNKTSAILSGIWTYEELSNDCKASVLSAMSFTGDANHFGVMKSVLKGDNQTIRENAAFALGRLAQNIRRSQKMHPEKDNSESEKVVKNIKAVLSDHLNGKSDRIRLKAARSLSWICDTEDIKKFESLLDDDYNYLRSSTTNGVRTSGVVYPIREIAIETIARLKGEIKAN